MISRPLPLIFMLVIVTLLGASTQAATLVDDRFSDGGASNGADPLDIVWTKISTVGTVGTIPFNTSGNTSTALRFDPIGYNYGLVKGGVFTSSPLAIGQSATLSLDFRLASSLVAQASALRFGLGSPTKSYTFNFGVAANGGSLFEYGVDIVSGTGTDLAASGTSFQINDQVPHAFTLILTRTGTSTLAISGNVDGSHLFTAARSGVTDFTFDRVLLGQGLCANLFHVDNVLVITSIEGQTIVEDTFADGGRSNGTDTTDIAWYTLGTPALAIVSDATLGGGNALKQTSSGLWQGFHGNLPWYTLADGDKITLSFNWRFAGTTGLNQANRLRFGLYDSRDTAAAGDNSVMPNNDVGYFAATNPGAASATGTGVFRESIGTDAILSGTNATAIGGTGASINAGTSSHSATLVLTRMGSTLQVSASIDGQAAATATDSTPASFSFDEVAFLLGSGGDTASPLLVDNIKVVYTPAGPAPAMEGPPPGNWTLTFNEDFNSGTISGSGTTADSGMNDPILHTSNNQWHVGFVWGDILGNPSTGPDLQGYTRQNVSVANGACTIKIEKRPCYNASMTGWNWGAQQQYASGAIQTYDLFTQAYGYFEVRLKMPSAKGTWPAFWLLPDRGPAFGSTDRRVAVPQMNAGDGIGNEIDIFEYMGVWKDLTTGLAKIHLNYHWDYGSGCSGGLGHKNGVEGNYILANPDTQYHNYGLYWAPGKLVFYVDGQVVLRRDNQTNVGTVPHYLLLNSSVSVFGWGQPNITTAEIDAGLPTYMVIDYVRVYSGTPSNSP